MRLRRSPHRQFNLHPQSRVHVFRVDGAAVFFDGFAGNGEAEAGAGGFGGEVGVEDFGEELGGDAGAAVFDGDEDFGIDAVALQSHTAAGGGLQGVFDEVGDGAAQEALVAVEGGWRG